MLEWNQVYGFNHQEVEQQEEEAEDFSLNVLQLYFFLISAIKGVPMDP